MGVAIHAPLAGGDLQARSRTHVEQGCDPRPPRGRRPAATLQGRGFLRLRSTPPSREATTRQVRICPRDALRSTPPSREATCGTTPPCNVRPLRSTPPSREATKTPEQVETMRRVAIHAPLAGGDVPLRQDAVPLRVAIHAPLAGGDPGKEGEPEAGLVAIHAPLAGGDCLAASSVEPDPLLRSTPPSREATPEPATPPRAKVGCDPRPPRGRRRCRARSRDYYRMVAIHAPLAGGDPHLHLTSHQCTGCDPRPPRGRRLSWRRCWLQDRMLRSTPPSREATLSKGMSFPP